MFLWPDNNVKDLGLFAQVCRIASNWHSTADPDVFLCPNLGIYKVKFVATVPGCRMVQLLPALPSAHAYLSEVEAASILTLKSVPPVLWAQGNHDVGLVKNAELVTITAKSSY